MKKKGFTLIELVAVLVILAILALIVTPLVMNIIRKSKIAADKRSIDAYGRSVEIAVANYLLDEGNFPTDLNSLTVEYSGKEVSCNIMQMKENGGIYLSECKVGNNDVKDSSTDDGWYHYGTRDITNREYVDMYGTALKNSSVEYYENNNQIISDYHDLQIDYNGKDISCDVTINYDGIVYLTNCLVDGVNVIDNNQSDGYYHYGALAYKVGDKLKYHNIDFYVIQNSDSSSSTVKLLKANPLSYEEVSVYGEGHNNMYNWSSSYTLGSPQNLNGYGAIAYYTNSNCTRDNSQIGNVYIGTCKNAYDTSDVKYSVDCWTSDKLNIDDLVEDDSGYKARLLTADELGDLGYEYGYLDTMGNQGWKKTNDVPSWMYNDSNNTRLYWWTMTPKEDTIYIVIIIDGDGEIRYTNSTIYDTNLIRPVITVKKSALNQ